MVMQNIRVASQNLFSRAAANVDTPGQLGVTLIKSILRSALEHKITSEDGRSLVVPIRISIRPMPGDPAMESAIIDCYTECWKVLGVQVFCRNVCYQHEQFVPPTNDESLVAQIEPGPPLLNPELVEPGLQAAILTAATTADVGFLACGAVASAVNSNQAMIRDDGSFEITARATVSLPELATESNTTDCRSVCFTVLGQEIFCHEVSATFTSSSRRARFVLAYDDPSLGSRSRVGLHRDFVRARFPPHLADAVLARYPATTDAEVAAARPSMNGDVGIIAPTVSSARAASKIIDAYMSQFSRVGPSSRSTWGGAAHTTEVPYVFDNTTADTSQFEEIDRTVSRAMAEARVQFAKAGHPRRTAPGLRSPRAGRRRCAGRLSVGVRMFQDVERVAVLNVEEDVLEPDAAIGLELRVLRVVSGEVLHCDWRSTTCAREAHNRHRFQCARQCAQTWSRDGHSGANANQRSNKKRA